MKYTVQYGQLRKLLLFALLPVSLLSCKKEGGANPPPADKVLLKEVVLSNLPSPYYQFTYNGQGNVATAAFSSGMAQYDVGYNGQLISHLQNNVPVNHDRIQYEYDTQGRVAVVRIADAAGTVYRRCFFTYDGNLLKEMEWEVKSVAGSFAVQQTMQFSYHPDGNLAERRDQRHALGGQNAAVYIDRFEQYDNKANVDGFMLLHANDTHLVLLPGIRLQKNNPAKNTRTGDGVHYHIDYTYTYNTRGLPTEKRGDVVMANGNRFESVATYSYFQ